MVTKQLQNWLTPDRMRRVVEGLVILILILGTMTGIAFWKLKSVTDANRKLALQGKESHDTSCAFRHDLTQRRDNTQKLLNDHPDAKLIDVDPSPYAQVMVARETLVNSVRSSNLTLDSFQNLTCSTKEDHSADPRG